MKKTRQTTADTPRASREPSMKWIAGAIYTIVFTVAALLGIAERIAGSQGGGIEAEVRGNGIARQVACTRDGASLGTGWTCRAEDISWENRGKLPDRVLPQKAPYNALDKCYMANLQFKCNSYKKDIHKRYCKKHQNIAGDRKWMPTVILRPLSGVA